ncbi:MAG: FAD-dependent oxidoreductase [Mycobacterium sp.]|nr:FAD-dependent oxidoreductase [Mycobacterium sp.]
MRQLGDHAVVLGAGMAGLLAAGVLSEFYTTVTVVERDQLPGRPRQRRGIRQGEHLHSLLSRGTHTLEYLFPGLLDELVADGANVLDDGDLSRIDARFGPYGFNRSQKLADPEALVMYLASRPFVEFHVRRRVQALGNVRFLDEHDVVEPTAATPDRVTGVRLVDRATGDDAPLNADLVVDAMGRAARTPAFLERLGYGRPEERRSKAHATYSSQLLHIHEGLIAEKMVFFPGKSTRGGLAAYEDGSWMLTAGRLAIDTDPPTDFAGMIKLVEQSAPPHVLAALRSAKPLSDVSVFRYTGAVWRRYDRMPRFPAGLLVVGDALCSLNPIYGQGMTMAGLEALALQEHLLHPGATPQQFFKDAAKHIGPTWAMNQTNDRESSPVHGRRSLAGRLRNWSVNQTMKAAENDIVLTERLLRVVNLVDPPSRLRDPALLRRAVLGNMRRGRAKPAKTLGTTPRRTQPVERAQGQPGPHGLVAGR